MNLGSGRSLGEENGNPLQYSCLENSMDRWTWWARVHGVAKYTHTHACARTHTPLKILWALPIHPFFPSSLCLETTHLLTVSTVLPLSECQLAGGVSFLDFGHSPSMQWCPSAVLIHNSLMAYETEHLFICLLAITISSFLKHWFGSFAPFLIRLFVFLLLSIFYIFDKCPLSDVSFANIFSQSVANLLILLTPFSWSKQFKS